MKHRFLILLFLAVTFTESYSQNDFRDGYIITNNNDTIPGLIEYKGDSRNAKFCIFRKDKSSEPIKYTPQEIKAFRFIDSKFYVAKDIDKGTANERLFLEYLIDGIVDIYYYRDEVDDHYFIAEGNNSLKELKGGVKEIKDNDKIYEQKNKQYVGLLKYTFRESPKISKRAEEIALDHKSLINIARDYHHEVCKSGEECIVYQKKMPKATFKFGLIASINAVNYKFTTDAFKKIVFFNYDHEFSAKYYPYPSVGIFVNKNIPLLNERISFQYEATYYKQKITTKFTEVVFSSTNNCNIEADMSMTAIHNVLLMKYAFHNIKPLIGFFVDKIFKDNYLSSSYEIVLPSGETIDHLSRVDDLGDYQWGLLVGIGYGKSWFFDLRYQFGIGLGGFYTQQVSLNVGIPIFRHVFGR